MVLEDTGNLIKSYQAPVSRHFQCICKDYPLTTKKKKKKIQVVFLLDLKIQTCINIWEPGDMPYDPKKHLK